MIPQCLSCCNEQSLKTVFDIVFDVMHVRGVKFSFLDLRHHCVLKFLKSQLVRQATAVDLPRYRECDQPREGQPRRRHSGMLGLPDPSRVARLLPEHPLKDSDESVPRRPSTTHRRLLWSQRRSTPALRQSGETAERPLRLRSASMVDGPSGFTWLAGRL